MGKPSVVLSGVATLAATIKRKRGAQSLAKSVSFSDDVATP